MTNSVVVAETINISLGHGRANHLKITSHNIDTLRRFGDRLVKLVWASELVSFDHNHKEQDDNGRNIAAFGLVLCVCTQWPVSAADTLMSGVLGYCIAMG